jgi:hypothetical protein
MMCGAKEADSSNTPVIGLNVFLNLRASAKVMSGELSDPHAMKIIASHHAWLNFHHLSD